jgi:ketosteroid isomerase-like protein
MSDKNKAISEEANAAIVEGNNEGFLSFCADDMEWTFVGDKSIDSSLHFTPQSGGKLTHRY